MPDILEITPNARDKRYGSLINRQIAESSAEWICVRDGDTMYLTTKSRDFLYQAIEDHPDCQLFTCNTNRVKYFRIDNETDILKHYKKAVEAEKEIKYVPISRIIPAFFWLFPRSTWEKNPFDDHPIIHGHSFDVRWTLKLKGKRLRMMHLYLFHFYRLHKPAGDYSHLR